MAPDNVAFELQNRVKTSRRVLATRKKSEKHKIKSASRGVTRRERERLTLKWWRSYNASSEGRRRKKATMMGSDTERGKQARVIER